MQLVILPLFLFSATFFPITIYPEPLRTIVELTPLYHGRRPDPRPHDRSVEPVLLVDVAYLAVMGLIGLAITSRRLGKLLLK